MFLRLAADSLHSIVYSHYDQYGRTKSAALASYRELGSLAGEAKFGSSFINVASALS